LDKSRAVFASDLAFFSADYLVLRSSAVHFGSLQSETAFVAAITFAAAFFEADKSVFAFSLAAV
jgi:hypothetical protein